MNEGPETEERLGVIEERGAKFQADTRAYGEQDENGVDLSLLRENLKLTPTERWRKHQRALYLTLEVRRAGEEARLRQRTERS